MEIQLQPADVFLVRGNGLLRKPVRFLSRIIGESRIKADHVGIVVNEGPLKDAFVIQALSTVKKHTLWDQYGPLNEDLVAVYRPLNLTSEEINTIVNEAEKQVSKKYGVIKVLTHLADWLLLGTYFIRRFTNEGRYPIRSWLVAHAYSKADKNFGCYPGAAEPDDIWDFVNSNKDKYREIFRLSSIWKDKHNKKSKVISLR